MADQEEEIEISFKIDKAKSQLDELKGQVDKISEERGSLSLAGGAIAGGLAGAAGQTGSVVGAFAGASSQDKLTQLVEVLVQQLFPSALARLDVIGKANAVEGRISPIAQQYAALTGQQLPDSVLAGLAGQAAAAAGPAAESANRSRAIARRGIAENVAGITGNEEEIGATLNALQKQSFAEWAKVMFDFYLKAGGAGAPQGGK